MVANAVPQRLDQKWQYRIRIQGLSVAHFNTCSELSAEVEMTDYHQGGDQDPAVQTPGKRKHDPVTLTAGASEIDELWQLWQKIGNANGVRAKLDEIRKKVYIDTLDGDGETVLRTHILNKAIMSKFSAGSFDASSSETVIESVTFTYKNLSRE